MLLLFVVLVTIVLLASHYDYQEAKRSVITLHTEDGKTLQVNRNTMMLTYPHGEGKTRIHAAGIRTIVLIDFDELQARLKR